MHHFSILYAAAQMLTISTKKNCKWNIISLACIVLYCWNGVLCSEERKSIQRWWFKTTACSIAEWEPIITLMNMHSFNFDNNFNKELPWDTIVYVYILHWHWQSMKIHPFMRPLIQNLEKKEKKTRTTFKNQIIFHFLL